jgi:hypothetical protein
MQIHKKFRGIPVKFTAKNTAEFHGILYVFEKIPYSVGSQKRTSVDTLVTCRDLVTKLTYCGAQFWSCFDTKTTQYSMLNLAFATRWRILLLVQVGISRGFKIGPKVQNYVHWGFRGVMETFWKVSKAKTFHFSEALFEL